MGIKWVTPQVLFPGKGFITLIHLFISSFIHSLIHSAPMSCAFTMCWPCSGGWCQGIAVRRGPCRIGAYILGERDRSISSHYSTWCSEARELAWLSAVWTQHLPAECGEGLCEYQPDTWFPVPALLGQRPEPPSSLRSPQTNRQWGGNVSNRLLRVSLTPDLLLEAWNICCRNNTINRLTDFSSYTSPP